MSNNDLRFKISEFKKSTGYAYATSEEKKGISENLINTMKDFKDIDNTKLTHYLYKIRRGESE